MMTTTNSVYREGVRVRCSRGDEEAYEGEIVFLSELQEATQAQAVGVHLEDGLVYIGKRRSNVHIVSDLLPLIMYHEGDGVTFVDAYDDEWKLEVLAQEGPVN